jgi:hypothetical protein
MSNRRTRAALPAAALMTMTLLATGCAAASSSSGGAASGSGQVAAGPAGVSGSGSAPGTSGSSGPVPTITASGPLAPAESECANWPAGVKREPLPASFAPVEVLRCVTGTKMIPGKGLYLAGTLERATSDLAPLVAALHAPSVRAQRGTMCPMLAMIPPQIVMVAKDGSMLIPTFPVGRCGSVEQAVLTALNGMPWQTVSVRLFAFPRPAATPTPMSPGGAKS